MSDFLPEEIITEILSRLPSKSLIRFRCVSKPWNSLITSPIFINTHLHNLNQQNNIVIVRQCETSSNRDDKIENYKLYIDNEDGSFDEYQQLHFPLKSRCLHFYFLGGYAKGLFCVFERDHYYLWNPSIRKSLLLPKPCITRKTHDSFVDIGYGFGFDSKTNDYKLVRLPKLCRGKTRQEEAKVPLVVIYSLNEGTWRINSGASESFPVGMTTNFQAGSYLEGAIHFSAKSRSWDSDLRMILSFDLGSEVFENNMILPDGMVSRRAEMSTSVFWGLLTLLCYEEDGGDTFCTIWIMEEYGVADSWNKLFKIELPGGIRQVLGIRNNGHIMLEAKSNYPWQLSSYDPFNQELTNLGIYGRTGDFRVHAYEENLVLLNKKIDPTSRWGVSRKRKDRNEITPQMSRAMNDEFQKQLEEIKARIKFLKSRDVRADDFRQVVPRNAVNGGETDPSQSSEVSLATSAEITRHESQAMTDDEFKAQINDINTQIKFLESLCAGADGSRQVPGIQGIRGRR